LISLVVIYLKKSYTFIYMYLYEKKVFEWKPMSHWIANLTFPYQKNKKDRIFLPILTLTLCLKCNGWTHQHQHNHHHHHHQHKHQYQVELHSHTTTSHPLSVLSCVHSHQPTHNVHGNVLSVSVRFGLSKSFKVERGPKGAIVWYQRWLSRGVKFTAGNLFHTNVCVANKELSNRRWTQPTLLNQANPIPKVSS